MKSIFLTENEEILKKVYSEKVINILRDKAALCEKVYKKEILEECAEELRDVKYIFSTWAISVLTEEEIKKYFPALECVFYAAGSVQHFARPFIKSGVKVFSAWAANAVPVAEYTVAQIILSNKGFFSCEKLMEKKMPGKAWENADKYPGNFDGTVGIIGAGMIGKLVIKMLKNYSFDSLVFDPFLPKEEAEKLGVKKCSLEDIFKNCQVVSNHLANNEETKGMLDYSLFKLMKPYATFINTGRGAQVVEEDLIKALKERPDLTALLDVTDPEPALESSEFYSLENCILTPHIAGSKGAEVHRLAEYMEEEYLRYISKEKCFWEVTEEMLKTMA